MSIVEEFLFELFFVLCTKLFNHTDISEKVVITPNPTEKEKMKK